MPVTDSQKAAIEQVIEAVKSVTSPRKKRVLSELFLELVDKETWANYYQVTFLRFVPLSVILSLRPIIGHSPAQFFEFRFPEASRWFIQGPAGCLRGPEPSLLERALLQPACEPDLQRRRNSQGNVATLLGIILLATTIILTWFYLFIYFFLTQSAFENEWRARTVLPAPSRTSPPPTSPQKVHSQLASQQSQPESVVTPAPPPVTLVASVNSATTVQQPPTQANTPSAPTVNSPAPQQTTTPPSNQQQQQQPSSPPRMSSPDMDVEVGGTPEPENMGADDMARDGESDLVVQQLERGLPRWDASGDFGWLKEKEGSEDHWLELVLAIKGHKDAVYVPLYPSFFRGRTS